MIKVVSTAALPLIGFRTAIESIEHGLNVNTFVYSESLVFEDVIKKIKADSRFTEKEGAGNVLSDILPVFAYRRGILEYPDAQQHRGLEVYQPDDPLTTFKVFKSTRAKTKIEFSYFTTSMREHENFEVLYLTEAGITSIKSYLVNIPHNINVPELDLLPSLKFLIKWDRDFQDKVFNFQESYYKGIIGACSIEGLYLVLTGEVGIIEEINYSFRQNAEFPDLSSSPAADVILASGQIIATP